MENKKFNLLKSLIHVLEGAIVGIGAILPGVSGGVLCAAFGLYEPMMELLTEPRKHIKKHLPVFVPFGIGWAVGFILFSLIIGSLLEAYFDIATMLFFGLVCGTVPELIKKSEKADASASWVPFVVSLSTSYIIFHLMALLSGSEGGVYAPENFWSYLFCGFMWGISLIVPGMSSSPVLQYLHLLEPLTNGIGRFDFTILIPFVIGIAATALLLARLVNMLFKKHYAIFSRVILGFVVSSALKTLPTEFRSTESMIISIICFAGGFVLATAMDRAENKQKQENGG